MSEGSPAVEPVSPDSLLRRALGQLSAWQAKYGDADPQWLPPAGDVRLAEDISEHLAAQAQQASPAVSGAELPALTPQERYDDHARAGHFDQGDHPPGDERAEPVAFVVVTGGRATLEWNTDALQQRFWAHGKHPLTYATTPTPEQAAPHGENIEHPTRISQ